MIRCREIATVYLGAVADFLTHGFPGRSRNYWMYGLQRQSERQAPDGLPRFGYMLDHDGAPVGVPVLISTASDDGSRKAASGRLVKLSRWFEFFSSIWRY